jgi:hypothetical protein
MRKTNEEVPAVTSQTTAECTLPKVVSEFLENEARPGFHQTFALLRAQGEGCEVQLHDCRVDIQLIEDDQALD